MATSTVYDAIKAKLVTDLGGVYPVRDWEELDHSLNQTDAPFIAIEETTSTTDPVSIGSPQANWIRDEGTLDVHIFVPMTGGLAPARAIADAVRASLRFQYFGTGDTDRFRTISVGQPDPGVINDGLWDSMLVSVDYEQTHAVATA